MTTAAKGDTDRSGAPPYTATQMRIVTAALELFAERGVSGTSLQMIAEAVGVTKAAVYHQFRTKEAIVIAAVEVELGRLEEALAAAGAATGRRALPALLGQVIDLAVTRRRMVSTLQHDPVIVRLLATHAPFQRFIERLNAALLAGATDPGARVRAAMIASAIGGAVTHPLVAGIDDATLRAELARLSGRFLELRD